MKYKKDILHSLFPFVRLFKDYKKTFKDIKKESKDFDFWNSNIGLALKLYSLTIVIPILSTLFVIFGNILIPGKMRHGFFEGIWDSWYGFYVSGQFYDIAAWRWQIVLLIFSFIFVVLEKDR
jgi:hypothetical protein